MQYEVRPSVGLSEMPSLYEIAPRTRSNEMRAVMFVGLWIAVFIPAIVAGIVAGSFIDPSGYLTDAEYNKAVEHAALWAYATCAPLYLLFWARMAQKASYRARDCFMVLVPIWSYVFTFKVMWRLTSLNDRPWDHRLEEYLDRAEAS